MVLIKESVGTELKSNVECACGCKTIVEFPYGWTNEGSPLLNGEHSRKYFEMKRNELLFAPVESFLTPAAKAA